MTIENKPSRFSVLRVCVGLYVTGAMVSFGPIAVTMRNTTPPGNNFEEREGYAIFLSLFIAPCWPLYWSYQIAANRRT